MNPQSETGCCPRFNPEPWEEKEVAFQDRFFLKDSVRCFLHIPLSFGKVIVKNMERIKEADALAPQPLMLSDAKSLWRTDLYIAVSKEVPGAEMERISGIFLTKVFEGPYQNAGKWVKEMGAYVQAKGRTLGKLFFCYTTCPSCARFYGKNYTVLLAKV